MIFSLETCTAFQFLIGSLEARHSVAMMLLVCVFQFLIGSLEAGSEM